MSNTDFDIFNLDNESFVKPQGSTADDFIYKPYPENGKDGVYKSLIRFLPNIANPKKSKIHKYYVWLKDPSDNSSLSVDCPSTLGKKSILKDIYWKLKNSTSAKDQELAKMFSRKEDYYSLIQVVKDANKPELEGKIMIFKFGKKVNDMVEQMIKPTFGAPCNPYDLYEGKLFGLQVRKVSDWNNYDLCQFVGDKQPIIINGKPVEKTEQDRKIIMDYLQSGPKDLEKYDYKEWTSEITERVNRIIRNVIPDGRLVAEVLGANNSSSENTSSSISTSADDLLGNLGTTSSQETPKQNKQPEPAAKASSPSLDDLYNDL